MTTVPVTCLISVADPLSPPLPQCDLQALQPSVWAIKQLLLYYAQHPKQQLEYYLDLHAHANKKVSVRRVSWDPVVQVYIEGSASVCVCVCVCGGGGLCGGGLQDEVSLGRVWD